MDWRGVSLAVELSKRRLSTVALQGQQVVLLLTGSAVDLSLILGPVMLLEAAMARGVRGTLTTVMKDPSFGTQPLSLQGEVAAVSSAASALAAKLGAFSFRRRLPTIDTLVRDAAGRPLGPNGVGTGTATALEAAFNAPSISGVSFGRFWSITAEGRESLGRVVAIDPVLQDSYDFDPLGELLAALADVVPTVVEAGPLITATSPASGHTPQKAVTASVPFTITQGMSIAALAARTLGDAEAWRRIVAFNNLRYPYIASDVTSYLGESVGTVTLIQAVVQGAQSIVLSSTQGVSQGDRILVQEGLVNDILTVDEVVNASSTVILKSPGAEHAYSLNARLTLYPPSHDVSGRVLRPGDTILIPLIETAAQLGVTEITGRIQGDSELLYGTDVEVTPDGVMVIDTTKGDLATATGIPNMSQALVNRLRTVRGSLAYHLDYGINLEPFLGFRTANFFPFFAIAESRQGLMRDPRVSRVNSAKATVDADTLMLDFDVTTTSEEKFPGAVAIRLGKVV